jgi:aminodeoxyfutalosine deaminase
VEAGIQVSIGSDDPGMFATTLTEEYAVAAQMLDLDATGVADLARTSVRASYASAEMRERLLAEIDDYLTG